MSPEPLPSTPNELKFSFHAAEWKELSAAERASRARLLGEQAKLLAAQAATPDDRDAYENLSREWLRLATEIQREANIS